MGPPPGHSFACKPVICVARTEPELISSRCSVVGNALDPHPASAVGTVSYASVVPSAENTPSPPTFFPESASCDVIRPAVTMRSVSAAPELMPWKHPVAIPAPSAVSGQLVLDVRSVRLSEPGSMIPV